MRAGLSAAAAALALAVAVACSQPGPETSGSGSGDLPVTVVGTEEGLLEGQMADGDAGIRVFRGIPYAAPPVGDLRFRPPAPPFSWKGIRPALEPGAPCWQEISPLTSIYSRGEMDMDENCLVLDLWTGAASAEERRPVMVWFHGGGHTVGHGSSLIFDGTNLARKGVVLVSANYRLGPFGFFAHPALSAESEHGASGNQAILDKIEALRWVQRNIADFGGDPDNVTIFGQSAGSMSVCALQATPLAAGLFHRAIGQSGGCFGPHPDLVEAEALGRAIGAELGIEGDDAAAAAALRQTAPEQLLAAAGTARSRLGGGSLIAIDGHVFPREMREIFAAGEHNHVPVLVGSTADEGSALFPAAEPTREAYEAQVRSQLGPGADAILAAYADVAASSPRRAAAEIRSDRIFAWPMRTWARLVERGGNDAFLYYFSQVPPVFLLYLPGRELEGEPAANRDYGAYHSGDLAYVFDNVGRVGSGWSDGDIALAEAMSTYWTHFARHGDPNGDGVPPWPRYEAASDQALELGPEIRIIRGLRRAHLDAWDAVQPIVTE